MKKALFVGIVLSLMSLVMGNGSAGAQAVYITKHNVELRNYNWRQEIADDPTTIWWCTSAFPNPSSPIFTVAIAQKLTSSLKRPFPQIEKENHPYTKDDKSWLWYPELPDPNGLYGPSEEYRYGFGPAGMTQYYEMFRLPTICTTVPKTWQRKHTTLISATDSDFLDAQRQAEDLMKQGNLAGAQQVLEKFISTIKEKK